MKMIFFSARFLGLIVVLALDGAGNKVIVAAQTSAEDVDPNSVGQDDVGSDKVASHDDLSKKVKRFNLHQHLMSPTKRDLQGGVENSRRLARNAIRLGVGTETHRALLGENSLMAQAVIPDYLVTPFDPDTALPSDGPRVAVDGVIDPLPFDDGPGVHPAFPTGTKAFWEDGGDPTKMWEVVACPVAVSSDQLSMNNVVTPTMILQLTMLLFSDFNRTWSLSLRILCAVYLVLATAASRT